MFFDLLFLVVFVVTVVVVIVILIVVIVLVICCFFHLLAAPFVLLFSLRLVPVLYVQLTADSPLGGTGAPFRAKD